MLLGDYTRAETEIIKKDPALEKAMGEILEGTYTAETAQRIALLVARVLEKERPNIVGKPVEERKDRIRIALEDTLPIEQAERCSLILTEEENWHPLIDRRNPEGESEMSPERARKIIEEFERLNVAGLTVNIRRIIRRTFQKINLDLLKDKWGIKLRDNDTPANIRALLETAYRTCMEEETKTIQGEGMESRMQKREIERPWEERMSNVLLQLGNRLRSLGFETKPITDKTECKPGELYKIYPPGKPISVSAICVGETDEKEPYFEYPPNDLNLPAYQLGEKVSISPRGRNDAILIGSFVGGTYTGKPVFKFYELSMNGKETKKITTANGGRYKLH